MSQLLTDGAGREGSDPTWPTRPLRKISAFISKGSTPTTYGFRWERSGVLFLRSECVSERGLDLTQSMFISEEAHAALRRSEATEGDILITITGNVGRVVRLRGVDRANMNQHIARIRVTASDAEPEFVFQVLAQPAMRRYFSSITTGQAYPQISLVQVRDAEIPFPPLEEQRAVAEALGDVDALLAKLDQLIAKKRDLKQAAMQQLFTARTRIPGFSGEWRERSLAELCTMKSGEGITSESIDGHSAYPCFGGNGLRGYTTRFTHDGAFVLIGRQGALCGNVLIAAGKFFASEHAVVATPSQDVDVNWLAAVLSRMQLGQYSESSAQPGLAVARLRKLQCRVPELAEQTAIAGVLSDMKAELAALEARRDKIRQLKQGMMQALLTGRIRLRQPSPAT